MMSQMRCLVHVVHNGTIWLGGTTQATSIWGGRMAFWADVSIVNTRWWAKSTRSNHEQGQLTQSPPLRLASLLLQTNEQSFFHGHNFVSIQALLLSRSFHLPTLARLGASCQCNPPWLVCLIESQSMVELAMAYETEVWGRVCPIMFPASSVFSAPICKHLFKSNNFCLWNQEQIRRHVCFPNAPPSHSHIIRIQSQPMDH